MRRNIFICLLFFFTSLFSQEKPTKIEYIKGVENTYKVEYYAIRSKLFVSNAINPYDGIDTNSEWPRIIDIVRFTNKSPDIVNKTLHPYLKDITIDQNNYDIDDLSVWIYFDLNGVMQFIVFAYSSTLKIPVVAFEELEKALKKDFRAILKYDPNQVKDVPYIRIIGDYALSDAQEWKESTSTGGPGIRDTEPEFIPDPKL